MPYETRTVNFDELEIEAEVIFERGCPGDDQTAPTPDRWNQTGKYGLNGIDISEAIKTIDDACKIGEKLTENFDEQING